MQTLTDHVPLNGWFLLRQPINDFLVSESSPSIEKFTNSPCDSELVISVLTVIRENE